MDVSNTYIKQCEQAEEIQENHKWIDGDYDSKGYPYCEECSCSAPFKMTREDIWLPRQDQLQEMVGGNKIKTLEKLVDSVSYPETFDLPLPFGLSMETSMEQFWLAYVMLTRYAKVWDGEEWTDASN